MSLCVPYREKGEGGRVSVCVYERESERRGGRERQEEGERANEREEKHKNN